MTHIKTEEPHRSGSFGIHELNQYSTIWRYETMKRDWLIELRRAHDLEEEAAAVALDATMERYEEIEAGEHEIKLWMIDRLAKMTGLPASEMVDSEAEWLAQVEAAEPKKKRGQRNERDYLLMARQNRGMSIENAACAAGCMGIDYQALEAGTIEPTPRQIQRIANWLHVPVSEVEREEMAYRIDRKRRGL